MNSILGVTAPDVILAETREVMLEALGLVYMWVFLDDRSDAQRRLLLATISRR